VVHRHADCDSVGAALGLQSLLGRGTICTPAGIASTAQPLVDAVEATVVENPSETTFDHIIVLDAPSSDRIAPIDVEAPVLIDHHEPDDLARLARSSLVDTDAAATAALVTELALDADLDITPEAALALLVGIFDDSAMLSKARPRTIELVGVLFAELDDKAAFLPDLMDRSPAQGSKMARALGVLRANGYRAGDLVIASTSIGGHEGVAADQLRNSGVDLAVVCSAQDEGIRVITRASEEFAKDLNLGTKLLPELAAEFGGQGGGHNTAGVANLEGGEPDTVEAFVVEFLEQELGVSFAKI